MGCNQSAIHSSSSVSSSGKHKLATKHNHGAVETTTTSLCVCVELSDPQDLSKGDPERKKSKKQVVLRLESNLVVQPQSKAGVSPKRRPPTPWSAACPSPSSDCETHYARVPFSPGARAFDFSEFDVERSLAVIQRGRSYLQSPLPPSGSQSFTFFRLTSSNSNLSLVSLEGVKKRASKRSRDARESDRILAEADSASEKSRELSQLSQTTLEG